MWQLWLILSVILIVVEIVTVGFLIFWFSIGALIAMIFSFITDNVIIQTAVFVISSGLLVFLTKPFVNKVTKGIDIKTNIFSKIGKKGIVTEEINTESSTGKVKVENEVWSAKANQSIPEGTKVKIVSIEGVKAIVEKC